MDGRGGREVVEGWACNTVRWVDGSGGSRGGGVRGFTPLFFCLSVYENSRGPGP